MKLEVEILFAIPHDERLNKDTFRAFRDELRMLLHKYFPGWDIGKECPIRVSWVDLSE